MQQIIQQKCVWCVVVGSLGERAPCLKWRCLLWRPRSSRFGCFIPFNSELISFQGTSIDQDFRYNDKTRKQVNKIKGIQAFDSKVDITRVYRPVINEWIAERINKLLGFDDEIVVNMIQNLLDEKVQVLTLNLVALDRVQPLEARMLQHQISGFLEKDAPKFTQDLWKLMLSAQENPNGIPQQILDAKKQEIKAAEVGKTSHECSASHRLMLRTGKAASSPENATSPAAASSETRCASDRTASSRTS